MCPYPLSISGFSVPCGKCGYCVKRRIQDWVIRCQIEAKKSFGTWFVTLTYEETNFELSKGDLQRYFKRLRKAGYEFTYFALGDYGDTFGRPHFHILFFNKGVFDSRALVDVWQAGEVRDGNVPGFVRCDKVSFGRIHYVVSYGLLARLDWNALDSRPKPFFLMSKRPAIGKSYLTPSMCAHHVSLLKFYYQDGSYKKVLPRYLRDKIFEKDLRDKNNILSSGAQKRDEEHLLRQIALTNPSKDANSVLWERATVSADNFLNTLRLKKKSKNKIL